MPITGKIRVTNQSDEPIDVLTRPLGDYGLAIVVSGPPGTLGETDVPEVTADLVAALRALADGLEKGDTNFTEKLLGGTDRLTPIDESVKLALVSEEKARRALREMVDGERADLEVVRYEVLDAFDRRGILARARRVAEETD